MMKSAIFISDIHLGCSPTDALPNREELLSQKLKEWQNSASHVFLLGDVFEFWMEYNSFIPKEHFWFLAELKNLVAAGVEVHYLPGNHDFNLGDFFSKQLGIIVHEDEIQISIQGKNLYLVHGDGIAKSDWKYRIIKKIIKHPLSNWIFKLLHPDWGMFLARLVSQTSRDHGSHQSTPYDEYEIAAWDLLEKNNADIVIHGHTHRPHIKTKNDKVYANSGQWLFAANFLELNDGILSNTASFRN